VPVVELKSGISPGVAVPVVDSDVKLETARELDDSTDVIFTVVLGNIVGDAVDEWMLVDIEEVTLGVNDEVVPPAVDVEVALAATEETTCLAVVTLI